MLYNHSILEDERLQKFSITMKSMPMMSVSKLHLIYYFSTLVHTLQELLVQHLVQ